MSSAPGLTVTPCRYCGQQTYSVQQQACLTCQQVRDNLHFFLEGAEGRDWARTVLARFEPLGTPGLYGALEASQAALIAMTSELGVIEAQMPGGLPYGIKQPKIGMDLAICRNAKALKEHANILTLDLPPFAAEAKELREDETI